MHPLLELGPLRLSTGGLLLILAVLLGQSLFIRRATAIGGASLAAHAEDVVLPALIGALLGARGWYGLLNLDLYATDPGLWFELRVGGFAWPGALLGGALAGYLRQRTHAAHLCDAAAPALAATHMLAALGLFFSGEVFGYPTTLPWGIDLFGSLRHPTQLYYAVAAILIWIVLARLPVASAPPGGAATRFLAWNGFAMLLIEALRADAALLPGGVRVGQVFGLLCMLAALLWLRHQHPQPLSQHTEEESHTAH